MEAAEGESSAGGEKEHDKLLTRSRSNNGSVTGQKYVEPVDSGFVGSGNNQGGETSFTSDSRDFRQSPTFADKAEGKYFKHVTIPDEEPEKADCKNKILKVMVTLMFILIVVGVVVIWIFHEGRSKKHIGNEYFDFIANRRILNVFREGDDIILTGYLKTSNFELDKPTKCFKGRSLNKFCYNVADETVLKFRTYDVDSLHCINILWENIKDISYIPVDCWDVEYGLWYGIPNFNSSFWPLDRELFTLESTLYKPWASPKLGQALEYYWWNTNGISILVHQSSQMRVSFNSGKDKRLCISLDALGLPDKNSIPDVNYTICHGRSLKKTHLYTRNTFLPKAPVIPMDKHDFSKIIWSYTPKNGASLDNFLSKLTNSQFPFNVVEYSVQWQPNFGDWTFKPEVITEIINSLSSRVGKIMLKINPFCSLKSVNFLRGLRDGYFAKELPTNTSQLVLYEGEEGALWDILKAEGRNFVLGQLRNIPVAVFNSAFSYDSNFSNSVCAVGLNGSATEIHPLNREFVSLLLSLNKSVSLETTFRSQDQEIFIEVEATVATSGGKKCLDYSIPTALTISLYGYPYIMSVISTMIDRDLFIRWIQMSIFFPALKVPDPFGVLSGEEAQRYLKNISAIRENVVLPEMKKAIQEVENGEPILRPLWWHDPQDYKTFTIPDQFFVGESLLVAPVLCHGTRSRDVYLPKGVWSQVNTGEVHEGPISLRDVSVDLMDILYFLLVKEDGYSTSSSE